MSDTYVPDYLIPGKPGDTIHVRVNGAMREGRVLSLDDQWITADFHGMRLRLTVADWRQSVRLDMAEAIDNGEPDFEQ